MSFLLDIVEGKGPWAHSRLSRKISECLPETERGMRLEPLSPSHLICQTQPFTILSWAKVGGRLVYPHGPLCMWVRSHMRANTHTHTRMGGGPEGGNIPVNYTFQACPLPPTSDTHPKGGTGLGSMGFCSELLTVTQPGTLVAWLQGGSSAHPHAREFPACHVLKVCVPPLQVHMLKS